MSKTVRLLSGICMTLAFFGIAIKAATIPVQLLDVMDRASNATIIENYYGIERDGRYVMRYVTSNGITHFETGYLRYTAEPDRRPYQVKEGYYIYPTPDGRTVRLSYFADIEGFRVTAFQIRDYAFEEPEFEGFISKQKSEKVAESVQA